MSEAQTVDIKELLAELIACAGVFDVSTEYEADKAELEKATQAVLQYTQTLRDERDRLRKALEDIRDSIGNTAWLIDHPDYTPTELREAAMMAASDVEWIVNRQRRQYAFTPEGTLLREEPK